MSTIMIDDASATAHYNIAGFDLRLRAPAALQAIVDRMLAKVSRESTGAVAIDVEARSEACGWTITGAAPNNKKVLDAGAAMPQVAGAVISSMLAEITHRDPSVKIWRAAVVEHEGNALVLAGDDWESSITLAAHLHTRGWGLLGGDYALISGTSWTVMCFEKSLHANSSNLGSFPLWYRAALEASPWYSSDDVLAFYAIDPTLVQNGTGWGSAAPIRAVLSVDGHTSEHPSLEVGEDFNSRSGMSRRDLVDAGIEVAMLVRGRYVETCEFIERWFLTLPSYARASDHGSD